MVSKYHFNSVTGRAGKCTASKIPCRFGSEESHYLTKAEACKSGEADLKSLVIPQVLKNNSSDSSKAVQEIIKMGFGELTPLSLARNLLEIDGEYENDITQGDLQNGECGDLAIYLMRMYGTEHYCIADMHYLDRGDVFSLHAVSRLSDGRFVDSRGIWPADGKSLLKAWGSENNEFELITVARQIELDPSWDAIPETYLPHDKKVVAAANTLAKALHLPTK
jgi:hypothetical protein